MSEVALYGPPKVGGDILAFCTKCKMELAHVIVSMVTTRPAKVICKTCRSEHKFRGGGPSPLARAGRSPARKKAAPKVTMRAADLWQQKIGQKREDAVVPYSPKGTFTKGSVLQHAQFGLGIVEEVKSNKISVLFHDGEKVLVHGFNVAP